MSDELNKVEVAEPGIESAFSEETVANVETATPEAIEPEAVETVAVVTAPVETSIGSDPEEAVIDEDYNATMEGFEGSLPKLFKGALVTGTVVKISSDEVFVDISWKSEGVIPLNELSSTKISDIDEVVKLGDSLSAVVLRVENEEGHPILSRRRASEIEARERLAQAFESKEEIRATVREAVKGGLLVDLGMRGFIPASQIQLGFVEDLSVFVGQELRLRVVEYDESKKKLILSQKVILNEEQEEKRSQLLATLHAGDVVDGIVRRLTKFGAFVDIGGLDGLLHISDMAFSRIRHPSEVVSINDQIQVQILAADPENGKVSLGLKQLKSNPWDMVAEKYPVGSVIEGLVVRIATFGAFVQLEDGIDALVHISQLAPYRVPKVEDVVRAGDHINAKVIECRPEDRRISLSIREYLADQENEEGLEGYIGDSLMNLENGAMSAAFDDTEAGVATLLEEMASIEATEENNLEENNPEESNIAESNIEESNPEETI